MEKQIAADLRIGKTKLSLIHQQDGHGAPAAEPIPGGPRDVRRPTP